MIHFCLISAVLGRPASSFWLSWDAFGSHFGSLGTPWGGFLAHFVSLGTPVGSFWSSWDALGPHFGSLGASWGHLGRSFGLSWAKLAQDSEKSRLFEFELRKLAQVGAQKWRKIDAASDIFLRCIFDIDVHRFLIDFGLGNSTFLGSIF